MLVKTKTLRTTPAAGAAMMTPLHPADSSIASLIDRLARRWRVTRVVEAGLYALGLGVFAFVLMWWADQPMAAWIALGVAAVSFAGLAVLVWFRVPAPILLAIAADRKLALSEKLASALDVMGNEAGPVAEALLEDAGAVAKTVSPERVTPWFDTRMRAALAAPVVAMVFAVAAFTFAGERTEATGTGEPAMPAIADVEKVAELLAAEAEVKEDQELESVANAMEALAEKMKQEPQSKQATEEMVALLDRAGRRFAGNPMHNWPPFEGDNSGLADRMDAFKKQAQSGGSQGPAANSGQGGGMPGQTAGAENPEPPDPSLDVKPSSLPGGGKEGEGLGIKPPDGQKNSDALEDDEEGFANTSAQPPTKGTATGAGEGESNMAGTGDGPEAVAADQAPGPQGGFSETQTLTAEKTNDASRVRTSATTEAHHTDVDDAVVQRQWPRLDAMPVERQVVPDAAAGTVARYFNRDEQVAP